MCDDSSKLPLFDQYKDKLISPLISNSAFAEEVDRGSLWFEEIGVLAWLFSADHKMTFTEIKEGSNESVKEIVYLLEKMKDKNLIVIEEGVAP